MIYPSSKGDEDDMSKNKVSKYSSRKVEVDGIVFDSKKEAQRYSQLKALEASGAISDLQRQKKYILIPTQRALTNEIYERGPHKGSFKKGKILENECAYLADFVYIDNEKGELVVEDTKGFKTRDYIIKRKLMLYTYGIRIREV